MAVTCVGYNDRIEYTLSRFLEETLPFKKHGSLELKLGNTSFETGQFRAFQRPELWGKWLEIYFGFSFTWGDLESN